MQRVLVTGAGGFIGSHLVTYLKERGYWVRGVDLKRPEFGESDGRRVPAARPAPRRRLRAGDDRHGRRLRAGRRHGRHGLHLLATTARSCATTRSSTCTPSTRRRQAGVARYLYTSSACIYPEHLQTETQVAGLQESDAFPADPQDAYGWEKILGELINRYGGPGVGHRHPHRAVPQHLRSVRHLPGRPREVAGGDVPQGGAGRARLVDRGLGRRRADPLVLLHRRHASRASSA